MVQAKKGLDVVVPVFNEAGTVLEFHNLVSRVCAGLEYQTTLIYVDDGSTDGTPGELAILEEANPNVKVITLSRNFGHQAALTAGLDHSTGEAVITMDADGQHPPSLIPELLSLAELGYDVVLTQRVEDSSSERFQRLASRLFYRLMNLLSDTDILSGGADFRLMTRNAVDAMIRMREYHRFLRGMAKWVGFRTVVVPYSAAPRLAGESRYRLKQRIKLGMDAIFSFSLKPLYLAILLGAVFLSLGLVEAVYVLQFWLTGRADHLVPGWSSLMFMLLVVGGTISVILGIVGIYVGYVFQEVKRRPIYIVRSGTAGSPSLEQTVKMGEGSDQHHVEPNT